MIFSKLLYLLYHLGLTNLSLENIREYEKISSSKEFGGSIWIRPSFLYILHFVGLTNLTPQSINKYAEVYQKCKEQRASKSLEPYPRRISDTSSGKVVTTEMGLTLNDIFRSSAFSFRLMRKRSLTYLSSILSITLAITIYVIVSSFSYGRQAFFENDYSAVLTILTAIIIMMAAFNFLNQAALRYAERLKEIGIRKVVGATRGQILGLYLIEVVVLSTISFLFAVFLMLLLNNFLNDYHFDFSAFKNLQLLVQIFLMTVLFGAFSGLIPALYFSNIDIVKALKGAINFTRLTNNLRRTLVVVQLSVSSILVSSSLVVADQVNLNTFSKLGLEYSDFRYLIQKSSDQFSFSLVSSNKYENSDHRSVFQPADVLDPQDAESEFSLAIHLLTGFTLIIASIGLFSLAAHITTERRKEIGIRKVVGGTVIEILQIFVRYFGQMILVATLIGLPTSYFLLTNWLEAVSNGFYLNLYFVVAPPFFIALLTLVSASQKVLTVSNLNPVESLRYE